MYLNLFQWLQMQEKNILLFRLKMQNINQPLGIIVSWSF